MSTLARKNEKTGNRENVRDLTRKAKQLIDALEPESLPLAVTFLAFLEDQECVNATRELDQMGLMEQHERVLKEIAAGKRGVPLEKLKRKY